LHQHFEPKSDCLLSQLWIDAYSDKYSKAIAEGLVQATQDSDGSRMTATLMQEAKKSCGAEGFPYIELKLIYTNCIVKIVQICGKK